MQLHFQLQTLKKGSLSMSNYRQKSKSIADNLSMVGQSVSDADLTLYILGGLSSEYESFVTSITTRPEPISLDDLYGFLLNQEIRLELSNNAPLLESPPILPSPAANVSMRGSGGQYNRGRSSNRGFGGDSQRGRGRGCDPGHFQSSSRCQVCNRHGHIALNCYHRFNQAYQSDHPPPPQAHMVNSNLKPMMCLSHSSCMLRMSLIVKSKFYKLMMGVSI